MIHRKGTSLSLFRSSALTRPTARPAAAAPAGKAASRSASSAAAGGSLLAALCGWFALFALLVVMPIVMLANGAEPGAVLMWMLMVAVSLAMSWFLEGRRQRQWLRRHGKPPIENYPAGAAFRAQHGTAERCTEAEKPAAANSTEGFWWWPARWTGGTAKARQEAPQVEEAGRCFLETRPYTTVDAVMDARAEAEAAGLSPTLPIGALERRFLGVPALKRESDQRRPMANRL